MPKTSAPTRRSERPNRRKRLSAPKLAIIGALGPAVFGLAAGGFGGLLGVTDLDVRMTWLAGGAIVVLLATRVYRAGADLRAAKILLVLSLPLPFALVFPRNAWLVMWLSGAVLFLWLDAIVDVVRAATGAPGDRGGRATLAAVVVALGLVCLASFAIVLVNAQMSIVPARFAHQSPRVGDGERLVVFRTADGHTLEGTYTRGTRSTGFVLAHGVAGGRSRFDGWAARLANEGHHVFRFDFRAHGRSDGSVCSFGQREHQDVLAALETLAGNAALSPRQILVVGVSMGGGVVLVASEALARRGVPGIVLLAPTSHYPPLVNARMSFLGPFLPLMLETAQLPALAAGHVPMPDYSPREIAASARSLPTLVFHGTEDRDIPPSLTRALVAARAHTEAVWMRGVDHGGLTDAIVADDEAWGALTRFAQARFSESGTSRR